MWPRCGRSDRFLGDAGEFVGADELLQPQGRPAATIPLASRMHAVLSQLRSVNAVQADPLTRDIDRVPVDHLRRTKDGAHRFLRVAADLSLGPNQAAQVHLVEGVGQRRGVAGGLSAAGRLPVVGNGARQRRGSSLWGQAEEPGNRQGVPIAAFGVGAHGWIRYTPPPRTEHMTTPAPIRPRHWGLVFFIGLPWMLGKLA